MGFRICLGLFFMIVACALQAQTRKIGHRSHGGTPETFVMMMGEEHLGDPAPRVEYHVDPFVERVRRHYERIAKKGPEAKADAAQPTVPAQGDAPIDSVSNPPRNSATPSTQPHPKSKKQQREPAPVATEVPAPDFLVQRHSKSPAAMVAQQPAASNMWLLLGLLAFPIAPGIFWASAAMSRKKTEA